jgi:hypothetical protein
MRIDQVDHTGKFGPEKLVTNEFRSTCLRSTCSVDIPIKASRSGIPLHNVAKSGFAFKEFTRMY